VEAVRPEDCIGEKCMLCELRCPDLAIQIKENQEGEND